MNAQLNTALAAEGITLAAIKDAIKTDGEKHRTHGVSYPKEVCTAAELARSIVNSPAYAGGYSYGGATIALDWYGSMREFHPLHWVKDYDHDEYPVEPCLAVLDAAPESAVLVFDWDWGDRSTLDRYRKQADGQWVTERSWSASEQAWEEQSFARFGCLLTPGIRERVARAVGMECRSLFNAAFDAAVIELEQK